MYLPAYPLSRNFVGRGRYREKLTQWWRSSKEPICTIVELGGMGKSSLAWIWLHYDLRRLEPHGNAAVDSSEEPQAVFWYSFYEPGANVSSFLHAINQYFGGLPSENTPTIDTITSAMQKRRGLVVLDGFERQLLGYSSFDQPDREERLDDSVRFCVDRRLARFLTLVASIPGNGSKVLITSRLVPKELDELAGALEIQLPGLTEEEAVEFLEKEAPGTDDDRAKTIAKAFSGHPLALRLAAGLLIDPEADHSALFDTGSIVGSLVQKKNHVLQAAFDSLDDSEKQFLMTLSAFRGSTSFEAALAVVAVDPSEVWRQVSRLVDRGFLWTDRNERHFDLHPIVRLYAYSRLIDKSGTANKIGDFFSRLTNDFRTSDSLPIGDFFSRIAKPINLSTIEQAEPIFEICYQYARARRYDEAYRLFADKLWMDVGVRLGENVVMLQIMELFFPNGWAAPSPVSAERQPRLVAQAADLLDSQNRNRDLIALLSTRLNDQSRSYLEVAATHLGPALCAVGRFSEGIGELRRLLKSTSDRHRRGHIHHRLASQYNRLSMRTHARKHWRQMKLCYWLSFMMDSRHSFEVRNQEFHLTTSMFWEMKLLAWLDESAKLLSWKSALRIVAAAKVSFLIRRLEREQRASRLLKQVTFFLRPGPTDAATAEQLLDQLLQDERQSGNLAAEADLLSWSARLKVVQEDLHGARAAAAEAVQLSRRSDDVFVKLGCTVLSAKIERKVGNRKEYEGLQREALGLIPADDTMAKSLRYHYSQKLGSFS